MTNKPTSSYAPAFIMAGCFLIAIWKLTVAVYVSSAQGWSWKFYQNAMEYVGFSVPASAGVLFYLGLREWGFIRIESRRRFGVALLLVVATCFAARG